MQPSPIPRSPVALPWSEVLEHVEAAVGRAIVEVTERAQRLEASPRSAPSAAPQAVQQAGQRCQALASRAEGAAARVADVDAALAEAEETLRHWLRSTAAAREKLATWVGGAVG